MKSFIEKTTMGFAILLLLKIFSMGCMIDIFTIGFIKTFKVIHYILFYSWISFIIGDKLFKSDWY